MITLFIWLWSSVIFAQNSRITGMVTGEGKEALPGVNVLISGSSQGTVTDSEGKYALDAPANASLVFSFIGYVSQTINVGSRSVIDVQMMQESKNLTEVVVTALGIKREAKTLGYATATVNADQISTNRTPNVVSSYRGKWRA